MRVRVTLTRLSFLLGSVLIGLAGCVAEEAQPELVDPTEFVTYVHPTGVFGIDMPPTWVVNDISDDFALNVEFSPPGYPEPLLGVFLVNTEAVASTTDIDLETVGGELTPELFADYYFETFYLTGEYLYKEVDRTNQPDGSIRVRFILDSLSDTRTHNDFLQINGSYFVALRILLPDDHTQLRTLGRIINTLQIDTNSTWVSSFQPENEEETNLDVVSFNSINAWADRNGGFQIVGQVRNNSTIPLEFVRITAQLYDSENRLLAERDDFVSSDVVPGGEYAPFTIVFIDGLPPGTVRYDLLASARYADFATRTFYGPQNFAVTADAAFDDNGLLVIRGQVRNEGPLKSELVKVIVTIFDEDGRVVGTDTTLVDNQTLSPGDISGYAVSFFEIGGNANTFLVTAQGVISEE